MSRVQIAGTQIARILVVEHNSRDAEIIERAFRRAKVGNPLTVVGDGSTALDLLYSHRGENGGDPAFGMVLLDLDLPESRGFALLDILRADKRLRGIPVIVLSGPAPCDLLALYKRGALAVLTKPIEVDRLLLALEDLQGYQLFITLSSELGQRRHVSLSRMRPDQGAA